MSGNITYSIYHNISIIKLLKSDINHTELFIRKSRVLKVLNSYHDRNPSTTFDVANFDEFVESNKDLIFSGVKLFTV